MKVKLTVDKNSGRKNDLLSRVMRELGGKVSITGEVITVDEGNEENRVVAILNGGGISYSRSK